MARQAIYLSSSSGADAGIVQGLYEAGCEVAHTHTIPETLSRLKQLKVATPSGTPPTLLLVAEVQAGAIALVALLHDSGQDMPPTLFYDRDGSDVRVAIKALQMGVKEYVLASDSEVNRELCACVLAQREGPWMNSLNAPGDVTPRAPLSAYRQLLHRQVNIEWNALTHIINIGADQLKLSPIEGRIFDLLYANRGQVVTVKDFVNDALKKPALDPCLAARQLRPHLMRLRRKLGRYPVASSRIVNTRGSGYMLV
jgi:DNA-binding response OmpR family regulator